MREGDEQRERVSTNVGIARSSFLDERKCMTFDFWEVS